MRLLLTLLAPFHVGEDEGGSEEIVLCGGTLAAIMYEGERYRQRNLRGEEATGAFLQQFNDAVFGGELPVTDADRHKGRARAVPRAAIERLVSERVQQLYVEERERGVWNVEDRVWLDTGAAYDKQSRRLERNRVDDAFAGHEDEAPTEVSRRVWTYMMSRSRKLFAPILSHLDDARDVALRIEGDGSRAWALDTLGAIADDPVQRYGFSKYSARVFPTNPGVASVQAGVRRALLPDCVEYDLASAQLAIAAQDWRLRDLYAFLVSGRSIWSALLAFMELGAEAKAAVKRGVYALVYGAGRDRVVADVREQYLGDVGRELSEERAGYLLLHPLMEEVQEARHRELERIRERGGARDCFGRWISDGKRYGDDPSRSILAQLAQARELWLMEPVIDLARREAAKSRADWQIVAWQHDGVSIRYSRRRERRELELMSAVQERVEEGAYPTRLEVKHPPHMA